MTESGDEARQAFVALLGELAALNRNVVDLNRTVGELSRRVDLILGGVATRAATEALSGSPLEGLLGAMFGGGKPKRRR